MWYVRLSIDKKSYLKKLKYLQNLAVEIGMEKGFTVICLKLGNLIFRTRTIPHDSNLP